jgi:hypothetical protein
MAKDYLTPLQVGAQIGASASQEKRMRDIFQMEKEGVELEKEASAAANQVYAEEAQITQKRATGAKALSQLRNLAAQPTSVRKSTAPVIFEAMEKAGGVAMADNLKQFVLTGKPEEVGPVLDQMIDDLMPVLTSPLVAAETIGGISRKIQRADERAAIVGPAPKARRDKFLAEKVKREREIAGLEKVVSRYANTKTATVIQQKIDQKRAELEKMQSVLSGPDATAMGVRPGTTLTESGTGVIGVLQGPAAAGEGDGNSMSLKSADEKAMMAIIAPEYAGEINLETGNIHFKTSEDARKAREILSRATRIKTDAGTRLTFTEAASQAIRESQGAGPGGGGSDSSDPYARF